jgi:subfamily B ATP-binding cassette protein HlyB/CyaB
LSPSRSESPAATTSSSEVVSERRAAVMPSAPGETSAAAVVVGAIPIYILLFAVFRPRFEKKMRQRFARSAESQQLIIETVMGAHTIKAAAVEPRLQMECDQRRAVLARTTFQVNQLANLHQSLIAYVSKILSALILFMGAQAVMNREMTIGEFVAFNMLSSQVITPVLRFARLWQDLQQMLVSVARLGDIMKVSPETRAGTFADLPPMRGAISLHNVWFHYKEGAAPVLSDLSLDIPAGQVIGVVGLSGSGKSTLTKLIQRLYLPQRGTVSIDGIDLTRAHPVWVRKQIGVVLQENVLFNRTIHENIALAAPHLTREQIIAVAKLAGADEFIARMPQGYDTHIEERGANLSGGQRQ